MAYTPLTPAEVVELEGLDDWRVVYRALQATFTAPSFPAAGTLVASIAEAAEDANHHPDLDLNYPGRVHVTLTTHAIGGLSTHDVDLARRISALAADARADAQPSVGQRIELAIDTVDADRIRPFWAAVLDYGTSDDGSLSDPRGTGPSIWFQQMDEPRRERNRFHLDIDVPHELAEERIAAAVQAGGRVVSDAHAKAWWVLADADGNEACICTWQDRGS